MMVCRNSKTARNGGTLTLKSSRPVVSIAMSNQIEADEIAQSATKAAKRNGVEIRYAWAKIAAEI